MTTAGSTDKQTGLTTAWGHWAVTVAAVLLGVATLAVLLFTVLRWNADPADQPGNGNLINAVVAAANIAFVIFTWAVFKAGQDQLAHMRQEAKDQADAWYRDHELAQRGLGEQQAANTRQLEYAESAYREAVKARLDQSAPRVSVKFVGWKIELIGGDSGSVPSALSVGTSFSTGQADRIVRLETQWEIVNWGEEPVVVGYHSAVDNQQTRSIPPGNGSRPYLFAHHDQRTVGQWRARLDETSWPLRMEVSADNLSRNVRDNHVWEAEFKPFRRELNKLMVCDPDIEIGSVADCFRTYLLASDGGGAYPDGEGGSKESKG